MSVAAAAQPQTLLEFIMSLLSDDDARAAFDADPAGTLQAAGLSGLCVSDVQDAMPIVMDAAPPEAAACYDEDVRAATATTSAAVSEEVGHHWHPDGFGPHVPEIDRVIGYLQYTTNNYAFDSHDVNFSSAVEQNITAGGDVVSTIDVAPVVAGSGGIAAGGDITAPAAAGGGVAADGDAAVNGSGTAAFGDGDATGSVAVGAGGAAGFGTGDTTGHATTATGGGDVAAAGGDGDASPTESDSHAVSDDHSDNSVTSDDHTDDSDNSVTTDDHSDDHSDDHTSDVSGDGSSADDSHDAAADDGGADDAGPDALHVG